MKRLFAAALAATASFAFGATTVPPALLSPTGSTAGQAIVSTGAATAPAWGTVTAGGLTPVATNTVIANATAATASPTAFAMPSCSGANQALRWTTSTGFTCASSIALTTGNLSQFAATTSAQLAGVLSDETGTGAAVFGTSPTIGTATINTPTISGGTINNATVGLTTPLAGAFTTLSATGLISPTSTVGIKGTTTNDNPAAGSVGEYPNAQTLNTAMTSGTATNCTSLPLSAGDWDVTGVIVYIPAATTTVQSLNSGITSASSTAAVFPNYVGSYASFTTGASQTVLLPTVRFQSTAGITAYAVGVAGFGVSTMQCSAYLRARRPR